ncbi:MAG TPA: DUF4034 domain-containing protein [Chroococcales cyanobacterium]
MTADKRKGNPVVFVVLLISVAVIGMTFSLVWPFIDPILKNTVFAPPWRKKMNDAIRAQKAGVEQLAKMKQAVDECEQDRSARPLDRAVMHREYGYAIYEWDRCEQDKLDESASQLEKARDAARQLNNASLLCHTDVDLGWLEIARHDMKTSYQPSMDEALEAEKLIPQFTAGSAQAAREWQANIARLQAGLHTARQEYSQAEPLYEKALNLFHKTFKNLVPRVLSEYFVCEVLKGKSDKLLPILMCDPNGPFDFSKPPTTDEPDSAVLDRIFGSGGNFGPFDPQLYDRHLQQLLAEKKFDKLEEIAARLRKSKQEIGTGYWVLDDFYSGLEFDKARKYAHDETYISDLDEWLKEKPHSATPAVIKANYLIGKAWEARGDGYANTVSNEGWAKFNGYLAEARKVLEAHKENGQCPEWYTTMQTVALGQGWKRQEVDPLIADGLKHWPDFQLIYLNMTYYLLPRWHGKGDQWVKWITDRCDRLPGEKGDRLYARAVLYLDYFSDKIFDEFKSLSLERFERGARVLLREFPHSYGLRIKLMRIYLKTDQLEKAKHVFDNYSRTPR